MVDTPFQLHFISLWLPPPPNDELFMQEPEGKHFYGNCVSNKIGNDLTFIIIWPDAGHVLVRCFMGHREPIIIRAAHNTSTRPDPGLGRRLFHWP